MFYCFNIVDAKPQHAPLGLTKRNVLIFAFLHILIFAFYGVAVRHYLRNLR